ncbi:MAG: helix-turn-helix domain-containing protein [Alphaproteobacteria bacterium]|nr:helix-turn-helix domain-containing protein [Alphaproteobacteria bacterium]
MEKQILDHQMTGAELRRIGASEINQRLRQRIEMIANMLDGMPCAEAARTVNISQHRAYYWLARFEARGLDGLRDHPRPGRPKKIDEHAAQYVVLRLDKLKRSRTAPSAGSTAMLVRDILRKELGIDCGLSVAYSLVRRLRDEERQNAAAGARAASAGGARD